jgi:hypothetical protein
MPEGPTTPEPPSKARAPREKIVNGRRHPRRYAFARLGRALGWMQANDTREG